MNVTVEVLRIFAIYVQAVAWPICLLVVMLLYKKAITSLLPGAKIKLAIAQFTVETSIPEIEQSVRESLLEGTLTTDQIKLLRMLRNQGRSAFDPTHQQDIARPLRDAGLIRHFPRGPGHFLANAQEIEVTTLGRLTVEAAEGRK